MLSFDLVQLSGLFALAFVAGTIDAMAGGGGLLTLPGLMATGIPPVSALATNKFQAIFSSLSATLHFWRCGRLNPAALWRPALLSMLGAGFGAAAVTFVDPGVLKVLVPFLLIGVCAWLVVSPRLGKSEGKALISFAATGFTLVPLVGFYDGFCGPGTGTFFAMGLVALLGLTLDQATMQAKLYNFMSNLGALLFFLVAGHIYWRAGIVMAVGMTLGGTAGAKLVLRHGTGLIKPLLIAVSLAMSLRLLWQQVWP
jgi:uncharacterized protein